VRPAGTTEYDLYIGRVHPVAHVTMNEYNNPSFATVFQRALLNTCITTCVGLNPSHHQVLLYTEYQMQAIIKNSNGFVESVSIILKDL
jgi:hypothetical protein